MRIAGLLIVVAATTARAETPPSDPRAELGAIIQKALKKPVAVASIPLCQPPAKADAAALQKQVLAWLDHEHPDEVASGPSDIDGMELVFTACTSGTGALVDVSQDRVLKHPGQFGGQSRRNFVLRVTGDKIETIAARTSTPSSMWMEWADEGRLEIVAELDVDGDGAPDLVWGDFEHEGGAMSTSTELSVRLATGTVQRIGRISNFADRRNIGGQLVVAGALRDAQRTVYACVTKDLHLAPCPATVALQRAADRADIANQLANLTGLPDHDQAADWLATLGAKARPELLAALPATTPQQRAERHVAAFLAGKQLDEHYQSLFDQAHPEATAFFDQLAGKLGDSACTKTPLTAPARAKIADWMKKQDKAAENVDVQPECGMYAWVSWDHHGSGDRVEVLVALDEPAPAKVAKFPQPQPGPQDEVVSNAHIFFQHGDTTVGVVITGKNMAVIANDRVVAESHGEIGSYTFDRRWHEVSPDVIVDSGTLFHPTPTGLEKLDRALVADHEARRHALERVLDNPPSKDPSYLFALRTLGADAKLVAECKKL